MSGVTAILSTFNRPDGLRRSLESLMNQARGPEEIIICDDGSQMEEMLVLLAEYEKIPSVEIIRGPARPVAHKKIYCTFTELINQALDRAHGDYICYLTDGNEYTPEAVYHHQELLDVMNDIFLVWGMVQNIKDGKKLATPAFGRLTPEYISHHLPQNNFIDHSSVMHRYTDIRWDTDPGSWRYADWLFWRRLLNHGHTFANHKHHCLNFYMDKDSFGRCLIQNHMSFEETMKLKMEGADNKPIKETPMKKKIEMRSRVKYAKNATEKIQSDLHGEYYEPGALVLLEKVMSASGNICAGFIPFGETVEYEPKKPVKPMMPGESAASSGPKTPFAGMSATVEAAKKQAEKMEAEENTEAVEVVTDDKKAAEQQNAAAPAKKKKPAKKKSVKKATKKKANRRK